MGQVSRYSAIHGLGCPSQGAPQQDHRRGAPRRIGDVRATTGLCEVGLRRMKVLREKVATVGL